jgi:Phosphotransferase enzyme family
MVERDGRLTGAEVVDGTVRRRPGRWTPAVHALLRHLEVVGFDGSPRVLGFDEQGREVLSFLPSDVASRQSAPKTPEAAFALGRLLRRYHDAASGFHSPRNAVWRLGRESAPGMLICHNDVNPGNVVYRDGRPYGLIDWDLAGPAEPIEDVARACILFAPLIPDDVAQRWGYEESELAHRVARLRALLHGYGGAWEASVLLDRIEALEDRDLCELRTLGVAGVSPYHEFLETGSEEAAERDIAWLRHHRVEVELQLQVD